MRRYSTAVRAIDPLTGELKNWCGPDIPAPSWELAEEYCQKNGLGYCKVDGEITGEVPTMEDGITPDFKKEINYDKIQQN